MPRNGDAAKCPISHKTDPTVRIKQLRESLEQGLRNTELASGLRRKLTRGEKLDFAWGTLMVLQLDV